MRLLPLAHPEDIEPLTVEERRLLCGLLAEVARGNIVGAGLRAKPGLPDLTGCRKLYFLGRHGAVKRRDADKGGWRVVYRYADDCIEVLSVGPRQGNVAAWLAGERLGRPNVPMHWCADPEAA